MELNAKRWLLLTNVIISDHPPRKRFIWSSTENSFKPKYNNDSRSYEVLNGSFGWPNLAIFSMKWHFLQFAYCRGWQWCSKHCLGCTSPEWCSWGLVCCRCMGRQLFGQCHQRQCAEVTGKLLQNLKITRKQPIFILNLCKTVHGKYCRKIIASTNFPTKTAFHCTHHGGSFSSRNFIYSLGTPIELRCMVASGWNFR